MPSPAALTEQLQLNRLKRPVWVFDLEAWRIVAANEAAVCLWGRSSLEELLAKDFSERSPAVGERLKAYRQRFALGESVEEDWTFYPPTGPVNVRCLCSSLDLPEAPACMLVEAAMPNASAVEGVSRSLEAMRHAGAAIAMFGEDGSLIVSNPTADAQLGLREGAPRDLFALFADPRRGAEAIAWAGGGAIFDDEVVLSTPSGDRWYALRIHPAHDPATARPAFVVSAIDVHERRKAEQRLSESEQARLASEAQARELAAAQRRAAEAERILREAIESLDQGFLLVGDDDRILMANRRYSELYPALAEVLHPGVPFRELIQRFAELEQLTRDGSIEGWVEWRHTQAHQRDSGQWEQAVADGRTFLVNERRTKTGAVVSLRTDITRMKHVESQLRERLQAIEAANDGIAITDAHGSFIFMNQAHAGLFGGEPEDFLGTHWSGLYTEREVQQLSEQAMPSIRTTGRWRGEVEGRRRDGSTVAQEISLSQLDTGGLLCVTRDIGERRAAEAERARLQRHLFQSQKMESLGRLAGGIAHDFNNILASMLGYANFLVEDLEPGSDQHRFAEAVVSAGKRAQDLMAQILAFGRPGDLKREAVPLDEVVGETIQLLTATLPPTIELRSKLDAEGLAVAGDRSQLTQVMMNLAVNARDAIGEQPGRITFGLRRSRPDWPRAGQSDPAPDIRLDRGADGTARLWLGRPPEDTELVEICVSDTGCGMALEVMQSIFEPFYTTKKRGQGTGLGLAAVHGLVVAHAGAIAVESRIEGGTTFRVFLPPVAEPAAASGEPLAAAADERGRVLVVDDEESVRSMLSIGLARRGFTALQAESGPAALRLLEAQPVDAVISDQTMPGMSGLELMQAIHAGRPDLPVVLCTGYSETLDADTAAAAGAAAFLRKPISTDALLEVLSPLLLAKTES